mgnify:CR=1 FL=1
MTSSSATPPSEQLRLIPTAAESSGSAPPTAGSPTCACTRETFGCSIHPNTLAEWVACMQVFLARILASPDLGRELARKQEAVSTVKSCGALASFDRATCSWKTSRRLSQPQTSSLLPFLKSVSSSIFLARRIRSRSQGDTFVASSKLDYKQLSEQFLGTWPRSGMTRNGCVYELPIVGRRTDETDGGVWLGTPTTAMTERSPEYAAGRTPSPVEFAMLPTPKSSDYRIGTPDRYRGDQSQNGRRSNLNDAASMWPTPCAVDTGSRFNQSTSDGAALRPTLGAMAKFNMWPTPTSTLGTKGGRVTPRKSREGGTLIEAVSARAFPAPSSNDRKGSEKPGQRRRQLTDPDMGAIPTGGKLNPVWVEWLQNWPLGWTETHDIMGSHKPRENRNAEDCDRPDAILRILQEANEQKEIQRPNGGLDRIQAQKILRQNVHGEVDDSTGSNTGGPPVESKEISREEMRELCGHGETANTPLGWEPSEQRMGEPDDSLPGLPHQMALGEREESAETAGQMFGVRTAGSQERLMQHTCEQVVSARRPACEENKNERRVGISWWEIEPNVGRVTDIKKDRVDRLKALGNGQVPIQAALAWRILGGRE